MEEKIKVREWIKRYNKGEFDAGDFDTQVSAGWFDWFCEENELKDRLSAMAEIVRRIKNPFILDNYYIWFKNNYPCEGPLYDDVRFEPFDQSKRKKLYFLISCDDKRENHRYILYMYRDNFAKTAQVDSVDSIVNAINKLKF